MTEQDKQLRKALSEFDRRELTLAQRRQSNMDVGDLLGNLGRGQIANFTPISLQFVHQASGRRTSTTLIPLTSAQIHLIRSLWRQVLTYSSFLCTSSLQSLSGLPEQGTHRDRLPDQSPAVLQGARDPGIVPAVSAAAPIRQPRQFFKGPLQTGLRDHRPGDSSFFKKVCSDHYLANV